MNWKYSAGETKKRPALAWNTGAADQPGGVRQSFSRRSG